LIGRIICVLSFFVLNFGGYPKLILENTQPEPSPKRQSNSEQLNDATLSSASATRKRHRRRVSSSHDEVVRAAQKRRDRWSSRREAVERRVFLITGIVFLVLILHVGMHLIIDQHFQFLNEVLFGVAALALSVWGALRLVEWIVNKKYKHLTKQKRADRVTKARDLQRSVQPNQRKRHD